MKSSQPLTQPAFYVLLSLHERDQHGYEIMKQVQYHSGSQVKIGPGTLYGVIKRLLDEGLIAESEAPQGLSDDERRRYYRLTDSGRRSLGGELTRFDQALRRARELGIGFNNLRVQWYA